jgi:hypothetical protein
LKPKKPNPNRKKLKKSLAKPEKTEQNKKNLVKPKKPSQTGKSSQTEPNQNQSV